MPSHITFLSIFATCVAVTVSQQCFGIDGSRLDDTFAPCNPDAKHSGCCATKAAIGADICLDSGLCMSTMGEITGMIWQAGCTDQTGSAIECPKSCPGVSNNFGGLNALPAWNIQQCDYGTYCCRAPNDRRSCCNNASAPKVTTTSLGSLQTKALSPTPSSSLPSRSTSLQSTQIADIAVATGTPLSAARAPISNTCAKEKHQTTVVGATIGGLFGAIIVGLVCATLWLYKKEARQRKLKEHYEEQFSQTAAYRRNIASTVSLMGSELEEVKSKHSGA